jgi:ribosomal-protein-alanine acetyltransferase
VIVRDMNARDLAAVLEIERKSVEAPQWHEAVWRKLLEERSSPLRCLRVAETEASVVGYIVAGGAADTAEIESIAVDALAREQGIGRALCLEVMRSAAIHGATTIELEVRAASVAARRLYASLGFIEQGVRKRYYESPVDDAVLMTAALTGVYV